MGSLKSLELIKKLFSGNMKPSERVLLSEEEPMKQFLWKQLEQKSSTYLTDKVDPSEMWARIVAACWEENKIAELRARKIRLYYLSAAVIALLLVSTWTVNYLTDSYIKVIAPANQKIALTLPDSSKVWLNAGSTIRYRKDFRDERKILLEGEAFFDVEKLPSHPFRVLFNDACVEVKGTEFNIRSNMTVAEITLYSGRIDFQPEGKENIAMKPLERIIYTVKGQKVKQETVNTEYDWRSDEYRFVDKPMDELVDFINNYYKVHLEIEDSLYKTYLFSGNIAKTEKLTDVLEKICLIMEMNFKQKGDTIILY